MDDAASLAAAVRAYECSPGPEHRARLLAILSQAVMRHAEEGSGMALVNDLDAFLSIKADDESGVLFDFLVDQWRADPSVAVAVKRVLGRHGKEALAGRWGDVPHRTLLVLPPRPLSAAMLARYVKSIRCNLGEGELAMAYRGETPPSGMADLSEYDPASARGFTEAVFIDGSGEYALANSLAASGMDVYRFDQGNRDPGFDIRPVPVGRGRRPSDYPHIAAHVFNWPTPALDNHCQFFPYGYLFRYLGVGPINPFGHRIEGDLSDYRQRDPNHKLIVCFGGSACFSMFCLPDEMFPARIEFKLNAWAASTGRPLKFTVLNFGQHSNVVLNQILTWMLFVHELRPDVVISHDGFNDLAYGQISDSALIGKYQIAYQDNLEKWGSILHGTNIALPEDWFADGMRKSINSPDAVVSAYLARERQFAEMATGSGSRFIWGLQPFLLSKHHRSQTESQYERKVLGGEIDRHYLDVRRNMAFLYESVVTRADDVGGADFINLHREFRDLVAEETHFLDFIHLSPPGDEAIADIYSKRLIAMFGKEIA